MFARLKRLFRSRSSSQQDTQPQQDSPAADSEILGYAPEDDVLLSRARYQWQAGDWQALAGYDVASIQYHPDRAKLALFIMSAHQQLGQSEKARYFADCAIQWGASRQQLVQILIADLDNSLSRAATLLGRSREALQHYSEPPVQVGETVAVNEPLEGSQKDETTGEAKVSPPPRTGANSEISYADIASLERLGRPPQAR